MIDIPFGKAIIAVEYESLSQKDAINNRCKGCCFYQPNNRPKCAGQTLHCQYDKRKDGKNVIFKLVDHPVMKKNKDILTWINNGDWEYGISLKCPECNYVHLQYLNDHHLDKHCPNCGIKLLPLKGYE